jgi:type III pantothenate kinase
MLICTMNNTLICLDFGNTRLKAALFENGNLTAQIMLTENTLETLENTLNTYKPTHSILSSVIHHNQEIEDLLQSRTRFHKLNATSKLPFTSPIGDPHSIGADRLALACAAVHFFPGKHNLVISLGSCITYNFINQHHQFLGGAISPGMRMRFKAMHDYTALLPMQELSDLHIFNKNAEAIFHKPLPIGGLGAPPLLAYDTATNLQTGVIYGIAHEIDGIIGAYKAKFSNFNAILTGGNTFNFVPMLQNKIFADTDFLFKGLYAIATQNF